jgi:hypothetical protein
MPLIVMPPTDPHPGASRAEVSTTPGRSFSVPMKSRPRNPMFSISAAVITDDRSPLCCLHTNRGGIDTDGLLNSAELERNRRERKALR